MKNKLEFVMKMMSKNTEIIETVLNQFKAIDSIVSIAIIGSYLKNSDEFKNISDIDIIIIVDILDISIFKEQEYYYKELIVLKDFQNTRIEYNIKFNDTYLDITVQSEFNKMNNAIRDNYENALGSLLHADTIYGLDIKNYFHIEEKINDYQKYAQNRKDIIKQKIILLIRQYNNKSYISYEQLCDILNLYFKYTCIKKSIFPAYGIKNIELIKELNINKDFPFLLEDTSPKNIILKIKDILEI